MIIYLTIPNKRNYRVNSEEDKSSEPSKSENLDYLELFTSGSYYTTPALSSHQRILF